MVGAKLKAAAFACAALLIGTSQASLVLQPNGVEVLDTDTNLLWLYNWSSSGFTSWSGAKTWAAGLTVGGAVAGEWRLPEIGEYDDLWADSDVGSSLSGLQSKFTGVKDYIYWSGTAYAPQPGDAWVFITTNGTKGGNQPFSALYAEAVRSAGSASSVPEPESLALMGVALAGLAATQRRKQ